MASSEVDQKFLGKIAKEVEPDNPLLAQMLYKILGLSLGLSQHLVKAQKQRKLDTTRQTRSLELYFHILWLAREGLLMLEQYVLPMVGNHVVLKVLAFKLRASFLHIYVLFHNDPPVSGLHPSPEGGTTTTVPPLQPPQPPPSDPQRLDKGKGIARDDDAEYGEAGRSSIQPTHMLEGGPVGPPPGFGHPTPSHASPAAFLLPVRDYLPIANQYFQDAVELADSHLWGSHSLRLSVKTEYAAFLYECVHDGPGSRKLASDTIHEVYEATEGVDDDMFNDACELVTVLGKMVKRGLPQASTGNPPRSTGANNGTTGGAGASTGGISNTQPPLEPPTTTTTTAPAAPSSTTATSRPGGRGGNGGSVTATTSSSSAPPLTGPPLTAPLGPPISLPPRPPVSHISDFI